MFKENDRVRYIGNHDLWKDRKGTVLVNQGRHLTSTQVLLDGDKDACYPLTKNLEVVKEK